MAARRHRLSILGAERRHTTSVSPPSTPRGHLPPRLLPVLYFGVAHIAVTLAFAAVALDPRGVSGFFYHSRMLGMVHLVTLGWITASIFSSLYVVGPIPLRVWFPATLAHGHSSPGLRGGASRMLKK